MKRLLLATAIVALPLNYARADLPVIDVSSLFQELKSYWQELQSYVTQLQQLEQEIQSATQLVTMVAGFIGNPSIGTAMALMGMVGLNIDLPINPYIVQSLLSGYGGATTIAGLTGKLSMLGSVVNTSYGNSHLYSCSDNSFACLQQQQNGYATSGHLGLLTHLDQSIVDHNGTLNALRTDASAATDPKTTMAVGAQATIENAWHTGAAAQIEAVNGMAEAQARINQQQVGAKFNQDADAFIQAVPK